VYSCIGAWIANSALCVLTNKHILFYLGFSFPTTLAVLHMASAFITTAALIYLTPDGRRHLPPPGAAKPAFYIQLAGIAGLFGLVLVMANSAFMYLSVPSIQMLKVCACVDAGFYATAHKPPTRFPTLKLTPALPPTTPPHQRQASGAATTFCVGLMFRTESYSHKSALKVAIVGLGVVVASYGDVKANFLGVALQVGAIFCDAVRCTLLQLVMQHSDIKLTPVGTLYHVAPMAAVILCIPAMAAEGAKLAAHTKPIPYIWLLGSCMAASSLNLVVFTLIGKTSALTTSVTGPLKEWVCILTAMFIYGTPVTAQQWFGYAIALCGIFWYQRDKFFSGGGGNSGGGSGGAASGGIHASSGAAAAGAAADRHKAAKAAARLPQASVHARH
jgi:drug/metabolite transporter (DMT)-like permease